jgi:hypothetical protein
VPGLLDRVGSTPRASLGFSPLTLVPTVATRQAKTHLRGYGWTHRQIRESFKRAVAAGVCYCTRCGEWIDPAEPWDVGHDDVDRSLYSGPEHRRCNRATNGRRMTSRQW